MSKLNAKSIVFSLGILTTLVFGVTTVPIKIHANENVYGGNGNAIWCSNCSTATNSNYVVREDNPKPAINSISPNSSNLGVGNKTVNIVGQGFAPNSIAKVNGSNRPTTFIDSSHLLTQITGNDTFAYRSNGGFYITVFNGAPGGGYSNAVFFKINNPSATSTATSTNNVNDTSTNFIDTTPGDNGTVNDTNDNGNNLASNAIFGSANSIYPSGIIQWILFAILVLVIVILVRKIYGADKRYHATPLKHD